MNTINTGTKLAVQKIYLTYSQLLKELNHKDFEVLEHQVLYMQK